jgi:hypothetical protein
LTAAASAIVGVVAASAVYAAPAGLRLPAVAGVASFAFVLFALRERAALRALSALVTRTGQRQSRELTAVRERVDAQIAAAQGQSLRVDRLAESVNRLHGLNRELAALDAASTAEVLDRVESTNNVLSRLRDAVAKDLTDPDGRMTTTLSGLDERLSERAADADGGSAGSATTDPGPGRAEPPAAVRVTIHDRITVTGLSYDDEVYVPAASVTSAFELESAQTEDGILRIAHSLRDPWIFTNYDPRGPWLGEERITVEEWRMVTMDPATGLPKTVYSHGTHTYPVTVAHYGLEHYSKWAVNGDEESLSKAITVGEWFVANQDSNGGWPVQFDHDFRKGVTTRLEAGWYSGMAQGMASALLSKLQVLTEDARYGAAASKSLDVLSTPVQDGGVLVMFEDKFDWWEEYPTRNHPTYVLNGFIYALVGVYDTSVLLGDVRAAAMYERGLRSLMRMVNLYDLGSRTAYDLLHFSVPDSPPNVARWGYHNLHVALLTAMNQITSKAFQEVQDRWLGYCRGIPTRHN